MFVNWSFVLCLPPHKRYCRPDGTTVLSVVRRRRTVEFKWVDTVDSKALVKEQVITEFVVKTERETDNGKVMTSEETRTNADKTPSKEEITDKEKICICS